MKSYSSRSKQKFLKSYFSFCSYFMRSPLKWSPSKWCLAIIIIVLWWKIEVFLSKHIQEMTIFFISNVTARNKNIWSNVKQLFLNKVINWTIGKLSPTCTNEINFNHLQRGGYVRFKDCKLFHFITIKTGRPQVASKNIQSRCLPFALFLSCC